MFFFRRVLECLLLPPMAPLLLLAIGFCLWRRRPRLGRGMVWAGVLLTFVLIWPVTVERLLLPLENVAAPPSSTVMKQAQAIVILGGGGRRYAPEYGQPTVNRITLERLRYGARLARETGLPMLVSGGAAGVPYPEARMMAEALEAEFGLKPRWIEDGSENTEQNASYSARALKRDGIQRILLVTHAAHMRRALGYFSKTGLDITPAPTAFFTPMTDGNNPLSWLPSATAAYAGWYAAHEWAGLLQQSLAK